nr:unnamed protein product [Callosobruchus chinensis]
MHLDKAGSALSSAAIHEGHRGCCWSTISPIDGLLMAWIGGSRRWMNMPLGYLRC